MAFDRSPLTDAKKLDAQFTFLFHFWTCLVVLLQTPSQKRKAKPTITCRLLLNSLLTGIGSSNRW